MNEKTPAQAIAELTARGWSEAGIARHLGVAQSTINRIRKEQHDPAFSIGRKILHLESSGDLPNSAAA